MQSDQRNCFVCGKPARPKYPTCSPKCAKRLRAFIDGKPTRGQRAAAKLDAKRPGYADA